MTQSQLIAQGQALLRKLDKAIADNERYIAQIDAALDSYRRRR